MACEWDDDKNRQNIAAHGIDFAEMDRFEWDLAVIDLDDRDDYGELRETAISFIGDVLYFVVYTQRGDDRRIISLRKASKREQRYYAEETSG